MLKTVKVFPNCCQTDKSFKTINRKYYDMAGNCLGDFVYVASNNSGGC